MSIRTSILGSSLLALSATLAGVASAQTITSSKPATGPRDAVSGYSLGLEYRNYLQGKNTEDRDDFKQSAVINQVRSYIGVAFLKDTVNSTLVLGAQTKSGTGQQVLQRQPQLYTEVKALDTAYLAVTPYLDLQNLGHENRRGDLGVLPALKAPAIDTATGPLKLAFEIEAETQFSNRREKGKTDDDSKRYMLEKGIDSEEGGPKKNDPTYEVTYRPLVSLGLGNMVKGLEARTYVEYINTYEPQYSFNDDGSTDTAYVPDRSTSTVLGASYAFNDALKLANEFAVIHGGFYQERGNSERQRYQNLASLNYTIY